MMTQADHASLVWQIKEMQRTDALAKEQWIKYTTVEGNGIRDPAKHGTEFLQIFFNVKDTLEVSMPTSPSFSDLFKEAQKASPSFRQSWSTYRSGMGGKYDDPSKHDDKFLLGALEYLGQCACATMTLSGGMSGGMGGGGGMGGMGDMMSMMMGGMSGGGGMGGGMMEGMGGCGGKKGGKGGFGGKGCCGGGGKGFGGGWGGKGDGWGGKGDGWGGGKAEGKKGKKGGWDAGASSWGGGWDGSGAGDWGGGAGDWGAGNGCWGAGGDDGWGNPAKRRRTDGGWGDGSPAGGCWGDSSAGASSGGCWGPSGSGSEGPSPPGQISAPPVSAEKQALIDQVKTFQRSGDEQKQAWWNYAIKFGQNKDPARFEDWQLQEFLTMQGWA